MKKISVIFYTLLILFACSVRHADNKLAPILGKTLPELEATLGEPLTLQDFPEAKTLSEKFRLTYDLTYFGQKGELFCSIDNKTNKVTFVQFYVEGGDYTQAWVKELTPSIGSPYTLRSWKRAIKTDLLYKGRTAELIDLLYEQGAREWPLTREGYRYEVATGRFTRPQSSPSKEPQTEMIEATWLRIFDMNALK